MFDPTFLAALGSTIVLGGALFWVLRAERREASFKPRLNEISKAAASADEPVFSLRRPLRQRDTLPKALSSWLDSAFAATGDCIGPLHLAVTSIVAAAGIGIVAVVAQFRPAFVLALAGVAALGAPALLLQIVQSRYRRQFIDAFPDALDLIVRAVRAGLPAPEAIDVATREIRPPVGTQFRRMIDELRIGTDMEEALERAADRIRVPDFHFFAVSVLLQRQTGGGIAETLANLSSILRQRKALRLKARALAAEAQASAAIVAMTPFVAGIGLFLVNRELMSVLFVDPRGRFMLGLAIVSLLSGVGTMKAMIKKNLH